MNKTYLEVMRSCWPSAFDAIGIENEGTAGDLIEAVFAWYYMLTVKRGVGLDFCVHDFIEMLERACLGVYVRNHVISG